MTKTLQRLCLIAYILLAISPNKLLAQGNFAELSIATDLVLPVGLTFDNQGKMYVWEKGGKVWIYQNGQKLPNPLIDIHEEVGDWNEHGLIGFALDPEFSTNGHFYLLYTVDGHYLNYFGTPEYSPNNVDSVDIPQATIGRVTRYTAQSSTNFTTTDYNSRQILIGESKTTGIPVLYVSHGLGTLGFGTDGSLLVSIGDGAFAGGWDTGHNEYTMADQSEAKGILKPYENIGAYRSQIDSSYTGKILRISPINGDGLASNPFYRPNEPRSASSRVWTLGHRNSFRFTVKPNSGSHNIEEGNPGLIIFGDVGMATNEEINIASAGGQNFGWPHYEGMDYMPGYNEPTYIPANHKLPIIDYRGQMPRTYKNGQIYTIGSPEFTGFDFIGGAVIGGVWYEGDIYPEQYHNSYFFADHDPGWIKSVMFDGSMNPMGVNAIGDTPTGISCMAYNPTDGYIYICNIITGTVSKIIYSGNLPPTARIEASNLYGFSPLTVQFDGTTSTDPENAGLTYFWDFGDGTTASGATPSHTFTTSNSDVVSFDVTLTVTDNQGQTATTTIKISLNNTPPTIVSTSIDALDKFNNSNTTVNLSANVLDLESPNNFTYKWEVYLHHNTHSHPVQTYYSNNSNTNLDPLPCDEHIYYYRITLTVTDAHGLSTVFYKDIYANCSTITDNTPPTTPVIVSARPQTDNSLIINWEPSTDNQAISTYELFRNGVSIGVFHHDVLSYRFYNLTIGQTYRFTLLARDIAGNVSELSNEMTVTFQLPQDCSGTTYLSDLNWVSVNSDGPDYVKKDISFSDNPLKINNVTYPKGLSMHANSEAVFDILPNVKRFKAVIGIDDEMTQNTCGSVVFRVYLDNVLTYESPTLYTNSNGVLIDLNVEGHNQIKLESNIGQDNYYCDHGNFADAKFLDCTTDILPPSVPTNISVSTNNSDLILSWSSSTDNVAVTEYKVFLNGILFAALPPNETTVVLTGMANQMIKDLHIQAYDYAGNISSSGSIKKCVETLTTTETYLSNQNYNVSVNGILNSTSTIEPNARVNFTASKAIILNPGFRVDNGGVFQTFITGCTN